MITAATLANAASMVRVAQRPARTCSRDSNADFSRRRSWANGSWAPPIQDRQIPRHIGP